MAAGGKPRRSPGRGVTVSPWCPRRQGHRKPFWGPPPARAHAEPWMNKTQRHPQVSSRAGLCRGHPCGLTLLMAPTHLTQYWGGPSCHPQEEGAARMRAGLGIFPTPWLHPAIRQLQHVVPCLWARSPRPPPALGPSGGFLNLITARERREGPGLCQQPHVSRTLLIFQKEDALRTLRGCWCLIRVFRPAGAGRWG